jgi:hypothetical protein
VKQREWAYFWWAFGLIGLAGLHRIYLGQRKSGILWLLTFGLFGFGQLYDFSTLCSLPQEASRKSVPRNRSPVYVYAPSYTTINRNSEVKTNVKCGYCGSTSEEGTRSCDNCGAAF